MRNFFMTFFFRERARTKNRSIRWLLPLSSWGRGWQLVGKKLYILKHVQLYIHTLLFIQSQIHPFRTQTIYPFFLLWYFQWLVLNFQTGRLKIIVMCIVLQNFKRNSNTQHLLLVLKEINNVVCYAKLPYPCPPPRY